MALTLPATGSKVATTANSSAEHLQHFLLGQASDPDSLVPSDSNGLKVSLGGVAIPAGGNAIGTVGVTSVPADPFGANADAASATGSLSAKLRFIASTGIPVTGVVPGVTGTALGKAVDDAAGGTDTGVAVLGVRRDTLVTLTPAVGDYTRFHFDSMGRLWARMALVDPTTGSEQTFAKPVEVVVSPSIDAAAYSLNDNLDGAILAFANAVATPAGTAWVTHMWVRDKAGQVGTNGIGLEVWFLNDSITPNGQNSAFSLADADASKVRQVLSTLDGTTRTYKTGGTWTSVHSGRPMPYKLATGTTLNAVVKVVGTSTTPTWTSTSDIEIGIHLMVD